MTGMYKAETDNLAFKKIENQLISNLWVMQELFVIYANGVFTCWEVIRTYYENGRRKVEARIIRECDEEVNKRTYLFDDEVHGIYLMWDVERLSSYYLWWPVLKGLSKMLKSARISAKMDSKRFVRVVNHTNKAILDKEKEAYENEKDPFLTIFKKTMTVDEKGALVENEPLRGGGTQYHSIKADSKSKQIWENIWNHRDFWFSLAGIPNQTNQRQSGKANGESIVEIVDNLYQMETTLRNLSVFAIQVWNLYGIKIKFKHTIDLESAYIEKNEENDETTQSPDNQT